MNEHLSMFDIDVWFADGKPAGEIAEHVASCERCSSYVDELDAIAGDGVALRGPAARRKSTLTRIVPAAAALALAAGVVLFVRSRTVDDPDYVGTKGTPAVQVLVRTEESTRIWDGRSPVHPGDALALHVACEGLARVTVAAETASGIARVSDGPCPSTPSTLPFTLVVDGTPGRERFSVVLTKTRVGDERLRELVQRQTRDRDVWVTTFDFPKEPRR